MSQNESCENCLYFHERDLDGYDGLCRVCPPVRYDGVYRMEWIFPKTMKDNWCGKWKDKEY